MVSENAQGSNEATVQESDEQASTSQALDTRTSVQKKEKYRFAANIPSDKTAAEQEYANYILENDEDAANVPDVLLDVPVVKVDSIDFELNDLRARVSLLAKVGDFVELAVGVDAYLGRVKLGIYGIEAQALLKVRLDNVAAILDRVLTTIDRNPQIIETLGAGAGSALGDIGAGAGSLVEDLGPGLSSAVEDIGAGAGSTLEELGPGLSSAVADIGAGAGSAVADIGAGAGSTLEELGPGLSSAVADIGAGAGSAVEDIGAGAGSAVADIGAGAGSTLEELGPGLSSAVADIGAGAGSAVEDIGAGAGSAVEDIGAGAGSAVEDIGAGAGSAVG